MKNLNIVWATCVLLIQVFSMSSGAETSCSNLLTLNKSGPESRIENTEPLIYEHLIAKKPFFSADENFYDPNTNTRHNLKRGQENPDGFDFVTLYRGLSGIKAKDLSKDNFIEQNRAIWVAPNKGHAEFYAVGNLAMKNEPYGVVVKLELPRFLVHWSVKSLRDVDFDSFASPTFRDQVYGNTVANEVVEAYLDSKSINDWRHFITEIVEVEKK